MCRAVRALKIVQLEANKLLLVFPTTYLCEHGFSAVANLKSKYRNRLDSEGNIQVALTAKKPSFQTILDKMKKYHYSH